MATHRHITRYSDEENLVRKALISTAVAALDPRDDEYIVQPGHGGDVVVYESVEVGVVSARDHGDGHVVYTADVTVDVVDCSYPHEQATVRRMPRVSVTTTTDCFRRGSYRGWTAAATDVEDVEIHPHFGL